MENIFLRSPDHFAIECAIRRAELLALGASAEFVQAVLSTRMATDLSDGEFWRTAWMFLIANESTIDSAQIGPMLDFLQAIQHDCVAQQMTTGAAGVDPPRPAFSIKGRTAQSMLRSMRDWHFSLGSGIAKRTWTASPLHAMLIDESDQGTPQLPKTWHLVELTNSAQLRSEGTALHHCVASYTDRCCKGISSIWSLRLRRGERFRHVLTIEVNLKKRLVVQARGRANCAAYGKPLQILQNWADREGLELAI